MAACLRTGARMCEIRQFDIWLRAHGLFFWTFLRLVLGLVLGPVLGPVLGSSFGSNFGPP